MIAKAASMSASAMRDGMHPAGLGRRRDIAPATPQEHPPLHRCLPDVEPLCDLGVAAGPRLVRIDHAGTELDRMRLCHGSADQKQIEVSRVSRPRINSTEHWG